jgi:hypothetical protein
VPTDPVLMFPGAVPIQFDTGTIELDPASAVVHADHPGDLQIAVLPTSSGRAAAQRAVAAAFTACLRGAPTADPRCPLPLGRAVPDSMTGTGPADIAGLLSVSVSTDPDGLFVVTGSITVFGRYQNLDFSNIVHTVTGRFPVSVNALAYTHPPVTVVWQEASS